MNVKTLAGQLSLKCLSKGDELRAVTGCYAGDLLSRVMGKAEAGSAWITIMSNVNVAAVASLTDVACVILAEDVQPDAQLQDKLSELAIAFYSTPMRTYEIAWRIHDLLERE